MRLASLTILTVLAITCGASAQDSTSYRVLATNRTSTMQKEMSESASQGYKLVSVMGGETPLGGKEVVTLMQKAPGAKAGRYEYRLLATSKTSTMQREIQDAADAGFDFVGQTVFESTFGGKEVAVLLERDKEATSRARHDYKLIATKRTSTLQKELDQIGRTGYEVLAMTVGETAVGGGELVVITRKRFP